MRRIKIAHLYPEEMNLYGDTGNILCLTDTFYRLGYSCEVNEIEAGEKITDFDMLFIGGGQDKEMDILKNDIRRRGDELNYFIEKGKVVLAICGGFQLLGKYFKNAENEEIEMSSALDFYTVAGEKRMIGNIVFETPFGKVVGFENHSGRTYLNNLSPLGRVIRGCGNNGADKGEGLLYKNTFCTYAHGPVLPKNPLLKYEIIHRILRVDTLSEIDDRIDALCHDSLISRFI